MSKHTLLLLSRDNADYHQRLQEAGLPGLEIQRADSLAEAEPLIARADIVLGEPARLVPLLTRAKAMKWMQSTVITSYSIHYTKLYDILKPTLIVEHFSKKCSKHHTCLGGGDSGPAVASGTCRKRLS